MQLRLRLVTQSYRMEGIRSFALLHSSTLGYTAPRVSAEKSGHAILFFEALVELMVENFVRRHLRAGCPVPQETLQVALKKAAALANFILKLLVGSAVATFGFSIAAGADGGCAGPCSADMPWHVRKRSYLHTWGSHCAARRFQYRWYVCERCILRRS